jgi:hypothetical protein
MKVEYWSGSMVRTGTLVETRDGNALISDELSGDEIWVDWDSVFPFEA